MLTETKSILKKINKIETELKNMKKKAVDIDLVLTDEDLEDLKRAESDLKMGKTKRL
ncbi:MAG TPA: hypothetical protein VFF13_04760 [archaeon]|nr:hypothetical protein [archaeon]